LTDRRHAPGVERGRRRHPSRDGYALAFGLCAGAVVVSLVAALLIPDPRGASGREPASIPPTGPSAAGSEVPATGT
jgi:hypothetical protein